MQKFVDISWRCYVRLFGIIMLVACGLRAIPQIPAHKFAALNRRACWRYIMSVCRYTAALFRVLLEIAIANST